MVSGFQKYEMDFRACDMSFGKICEMTFGKVWETAEKKSALYGFKNDALNFIRSGRPAKKYAAPSHFYLHLDPKVMSHERH